MSDAFKITADVKPHNGRRRWRRHVPGEGWIGGQRLLIWLVLNYQRVIAPVGRRFGKTTSLLFLFLELAIRTSGKCYIGVWSQDHDKARELMEVFITAYGDLVSKVNKSAGQTRYIELRPMGKSTGGTRIYFWSAAHPAYNRVRGFVHPFHLIVADESTYIRGNAVLKVSLKMLADCGGKFLAIGTPDFDGVGFAWFSLFWSRACSSDKKWREWEGMNFPSEANPTIPLAYIKTMREECGTKEEEQQEIDAEFLQDTSSVFGEVRRAFCLRFMEKSPAFVRKAEEAAGVDRDAFRSWVADKPRSGVPYVIGVDWGRKLDSTIITIWRQDTRREVARFALSGGDWDEQMLFLVAIRKAYGDCSIRSDAHGVGDAMSQILKKKFSEDVVEVTWGGQKKEHLVRRLQHLIEDDAIKFIAADEAFQEFRLYQGEKNEKTGRVRYSAPDGGHDDHVDATLCVADALLVAIGPEPDEGAEIKPDPAPEGTWAELRREQGIRDWTSRVQECQI